MFELSASHVNQTPPDWLEGYGEKSSSFSTVATVPDAMDSGAWIKIV